MTNSDVQSAYQPQGKLFYAMMAASDSYSAGFDACVFCADAADEPAGEKRQEFYC